MAHNEMIRSLKRKSKPIGSAGLSIPLGHSPNQRCCRAGISNQLRRLQFILRHNRRRKLSKSLLPFQRALHRLQTHMSEYRFPPIYPIMSHQSLDHTGSPPCVLSLWISIETLDNSVYVARTKRQGRHWFRPVEQLFKLFILWELPYHDCSRRGSFKIPVADLDLIAPFLWLIDQPGIDEEISASLGLVRKKRPVLACVDSLIPGKAVVEVE